MDKSPGLNQLGIWREGLRIGLSTLPREPVLGLKRLVLPVSYWRTAEFAYVFRQLPPKPGAKVLDIGSPKDLAAMLARKRRYEVVATDILPEAVQLGARYTDAQGLTGSGPGRVAYQVADGRLLPYADDSFDHAFSVSVLEHIPDDGDERTIQELSRIVQPGGRIVITVPFDESYRETWVDHDVYERSRASGESVFWQRHYDDDALRARLLDPSGGSLLALSFWGEGRVGVERALARLQGVTGMDVLAAPMEPLLSYLFLREADGGGGRRRMAAFLTLEVQSGLSDGPAGKRSARGEP